jgi:hypothetical protein
LKFVWEGLPLVIVIILQNWKKTLIRRGRKKRVFFRPSNVGLGKE